MAEETFSEKDMEVAEILRDLSSIIESRPHVFTEDVQWGLRRRRPEPIYVTNSESQQADPADPKEPLPAVAVEQKKDEPTAATGSGELLCSLKSGSDAQLSAPPPKQVKKKKSKRREIIKEHEKAIARLTKENEDLKTELVELKEKYEKLIAKNNDMKDYQTRRLSPDASKKKKDDQTLDDELKTAGPSQTIKQRISAVMVFKCKSPQQPPPLEHVTDQNCRQEGDLRAQPSEGMAECAMKASLMCQFDEDQDKVAKSRGARKRRQEIVREKKAHKRANESSDH